MGTPKARGVVMFSGGAGSWAAAKRAVAIHQQVTLLFADTRFEDGDLYRFLPEAAANVGAELVTISDGRDIWQVFRDKRFLGNSRVDPCSRILKRELMRRWIEENRDPADTAVHLGIGWQEIHRWERAVPLWEPWELLAPMCTPPYLDHDQVISWMRAEGLEPPLLYSMGFEHNNCGGGCVKAGQAQFALLLEMMPARYAEWERREQELRDYLGKDVAILTDRRGKTRKPFTLRAFRERMEAEGREGCDTTDHGSCSCLSPDREYDEAELEAARE